MRLWHKDMLDVLPRQQLLGQWRELNSVYRKQNRHVLINFIYDRDNAIDELYNYSVLVLSEMDNRGYKINTTNFKNFFGCIPLGYIDYDEIYKDKMNTRYLKQCLYNLQEKYDCGGITKEEWDKIYNKFKEYIEY